MPDSIGHHRRYKQGEKSRYQLHTWEVLQFPINTVLLLQVPIPQEQREELQEVRRGHSVRQENIKLFHSMFHEHCL